MGGELGIDMWWEAEDKPEGFWTRYRFYFAWLTALIATLGSLYLSEIQGFIPCDLCWYQRILMYPLAIILGIAVYKGDRGIARYALPLAIIGGLISLYHNVEIWNPSIAGFVPCKSGIPCNRDYLNWFGFITIPLMALSAFLIIIACLLIGSKQPD